MRPARGAPRFAERALVTHRGLSGPAILQISSYWQFQASAGAPRSPVVLDLLPGQDARAWLAEHAGSRATLPNLLAEVLPRRLAHGWCELHGGPAGIDEHSPAARQAMARALNAWTLVPSGTLGYSKAEVTLGGVDTRALSSQTMEARDVPGLYLHRRGRGCDGMARRLQFPVGLVFGLGGRTIRMNTQDRLHDL